MDGHTTHKPPAKGVYPPQTGFGWTNAVFEHFCQDLFDKPKKYLPASEDDYIASSTFGDLQFVTGIIILANA